MAPAFLADENVEMDIVDRLKSLGHIAVHASELPGKFSSRMTRISESSSSESIIALSASYSFGCPVGLPPSRLEWLHMPSSATAESFWARS